jgi:hypothetical protein
MPAATFFLVSIFEVKVQLILELVVDAPAKCDGAYPKPHIARVHLTPSLGRN